MQFYMTLVVLALAVSNVSPALSAPILVRKQSLSHREPTIGAAVVRRAAWGALLKKIGIDLGIGVGSTVAGYTAIDAITGPPAASPSQTPPSSEGGTPPATPETVTVPPAATPPAAAPPPSPPPPPSPTLSPSSSPPPQYTSVTTPVNLVTPATSTTPATPESPTPANSSTPATSTTPNTDSNDGNNSNNSNAGTEESTDDADSSSSSSASIFGRSVSNENRRAISALELLDRTDLEDALKLFKRLLDELD